MCQYKGIQVCRDSSRLTHGALQLPQLEWLHNSNIVATRSVNMDSNCNYNNYSIMTSQHNHKHEQDGIARSSDNGDTIVSRQPAAAEHVGLGAGVSSRTGSNASIKSEGGAQEGGGKATDGLNFASFSNFGNFGNAKNCNGGCGGGRNVSRGNDNTVTKPDQVANRYNKLEMDQLDQLNPSANGMILHPSIDSETKTTATISATSTASTTSTNTSSITTIRTSTGMRNGTANASSKESSIQLWTGQFAATGSDIGDEQDLTELENKRDGKDSKDGKEGKDGKICPYCDKIFMRRSNLKEHIRVHTGETPFTCDICNRGFKQQHSLKDHKRTHTGEKPYQCNMCSKSFAVKHNLKVHQRYTFRKIV